MHTDDNNAIRYLMKEMDPSEELEFEKLMREDENLLIEVESLRATNKKLSDLSLIQPPSHLTDQIKDEAKNVKSNTLLNLKPVSIFYLKRGLAAAILLTAFTGGYYYFNSEAPIKEQVSTHTEKVEPWVDRNEVIRFSVSPQLQNTSNVQDDYSKSYDKLQLVNDPTTNINSNQGILLTGSSN